MLVSGAIAYAILMWLGFKMCRYVGVSLTGKGLGNNKAKVIEMNKQLTKTLVVQVHFFRESVSIITKKQAILPFPIYGAFLIGMAQILLSQFISLGPYATVLQYYTICSSMLQYIPSAINPFVSISPKKTFKINILVTNIIFFPKNYTKFSIK